MLKKIASLSFGSLLLLIPLVTSATSPSTLADFADDYISGMTPDTYCPHLTSTFKRGARDKTTGGQVSELQAFLTDYFNLVEGVVVGGYFGPLTQKYVAQFQAEKGLPAFGIAGPLTRAEIARVCGARQPSKETFSSPPSPNEAIIRLGQEKNIVSPSCPQYQVPLCPWGKHSESATSSIDANGCTVPVYSCVEDISGYSTRNDNSVNYSSGNSSSNYTCKYGNSTSNTSTGLAGCRSWCLKVGTFPYSTCTYKESSSGFTLDVNLGVYGVPAPHEYPAATDSSPLCTYENKSMHTNGGIEACKYWCFTVGRIPFSDCKYKELTSGVTFLADLGPLAMPKPHDYPAATESSPLCTYGNKSMHTNGGSYACRYWCFSVGTPPFDEGCVYKDLVSGATFVQDMNLPVPNENYVIPSASIPQKDSNLAAALTALQAVLGQLIDQLGQ